MSEPEIKLDERKSAVLSAVIVQHCATCNPVGSDAVLENADIEASPATIRNEMADLEKKGYLIKPHPSGGRIPTEKGIRYFVNQIDKDSLDFNNPKSLKEFYQSLRGEIEEVLINTASMLSTLTNYAAVVIEPESETSNEKLVSIKLVKLSEKRVLIVKVFSDDSVDTKDVLLNSGEMLEDSDLADVTAALNKKFVENSKVGPLQPKLYKTLVSQLEDESDSSAKLYIDGASKLIGNFDAIETVKEVLTILEQQLVVATLMSEVVEQNVAVAIGSETGLALNQCSLVVSPYSVEGSNKGTIAVLGPLRMNYEDTMTKVAAVGHHLGNKLSEG